MGNESFLQRQGARMMEEHGFLGVPSNTFEEAGRNQFQTLIGLGILPDSKVLDIGCGVLRLAYWLIHFLKENGYYGIEPAQNRVELGKQYLFDQSLLMTKRPSFDFNEDFDSSVFPVLFDFFVAGSIWTHCGKTSIQKMLDHFQNQSTENGIFLASYIPAKSENEEYLGDSWVGTSHKSSVAGCIKHSKAWIEEACRKRNLKLTELPFEAFDSQRWLKVERV